MEYTTEQSLAIKFYNSEDSKEVDLFLSMLKKCADEAKKPGYKGMFNKEEKAFIAQMYEEFSKYE